ncbi:hypothetical protein P9E08_08700 [Bacillus mojavensis]|uniref:hypothetical protein n=1 Tax=Bacillus mojavensis TaxID=72360 RepID=UPI002DB5BCA5|nr:hypothetical protein [Bacillus mojavensis]MEC1625457.1 hypothetical protein [Bacillus mojavensis]
MNEKYLWKFDWGNDCAYVGGLFVATEDEVANLIGKTVDFGEVAGDYSEVFGVFEEDDIRKVDIDSETVANVSAVLGDTWAGYNPLNYVEEAE